MFQNFFPVARGRGKFQDFFPLGNLDGLEPGNFLPGIVALQGIFSGVFCIFNGLFSLLKNLLSLCTGRSALSHVCPLNHNHFLLSRLVWICFLYNGHGPIWSIHDQTQPTTKNENNLVSYSNFHINGHGPTGYVILQSDP